MTAAYTGGCRCGRVRYRVDGPLRPVVACHCRECRQGSGHYWAATRAYRGDLHLERDDGLRWFDSSTAARRGFCTVCGANLFFDRHSSEGVTIGAGTLDEPTGLRLVQHIYTAEAGDYYTIADGQPQYPYTGEIPPIEEQ